jgi:Zn finger protein HypA/HybF involved in hydrogenase expression
MPKLKHVSPARILRAVEADDMSGFCCACGADAHNVEPDAEKYECETCGEHKVYGAEQLLLLGYAGGY